MQARTADMLSESRRLRAALQTSEARSGLVQQFLQQYQLSHDEVYALKVWRFSWQPLRSPRRQHARLPTPIGRARILLGPECPQHAASISQTPHLQC